jgi:hypothetical protein
MVRKLVVLICVGVALALGASAGTSQANIPGEPGGTFWCNAWNDGYSIWIPVWLPGWYRCEWGCEPWHTLEYYGPTSYVEGPEFSCRWMWMGPKPWP